MVVREWASWTDGGATDGDPGFGIGRKPQVRLAGAGIVR
jgi:hypothetical protein